MGQTEPDERAESMKPIINGVLAAAALLGLLTACSDDPKTTTSTIPSGNSIPSDLSIPTAVIDQLVTTFEANGMKVDRPCLDNLMKDDELRQLIAAQGTPSAELIQRLTACFKA